MEIQARWRELKGSNRWLKMKTEKRWTHEEVKAETKIRLHKPLVEHERGRNQNLTKAAEALRQMTARGERRSRT